MINVDTFRQDISEISNNLSQIGDFSLEITLTDECNFRCAYCFEGDECLKDTSLNCIEDIFESVDKWLKDDWFLSIFKGVRIGFWGGEPTLRPDIIKKFADHFKDNSRVRFHIYTNGYNVDGLMDAFKDCKDKIDVQVSYDGEKINDLKRFTKGKQTVTPRVRANIYRLHENGFSVKLKSTVTYDTMEYMAECWDDIKKINDDIGEDIKYSPTVDYIMDGGVKMDMEHVRKCFVKVAKKELKFHEEKGYHLFTWFNSTEPLVCNFFKYGMAINTNGDMLYCHGCGYSPEKSAMCFGNISDDDVIEKIKHNYNYFNPPDKVDGCEGCIATQCCTCNVVKYEHSKKTDFLDRWYDLSCQQNQCDMFREFTKVSISLKDIIGRN